ncbi:Hypothetical protein NocV09_01001870 [Nannochloropsis oceanica]
MAGPKYHWTGAGLFIALLLLLAASCPQAFLVLVPSHRRHRPSRRFVLDPSIVKDVVTDVAQSGGGANGPQQVAKAMIQLLQGPSGVGIFGLVALSVRLYTYFTVQSYIAKLCTLFANSGTTVELRYGNSLRNLFYYEPGPGKMERLIVPTGDPKNIQTIAEVCARLKVAAKATYDVTALPESFEQLKLPADSVDTIVSTYMLNKSKQPLVTFTKAMELLRDDGILIFVEPVCGDNALLSFVRKYFGAIHRSTGAFGDPGLDIKTIVNVWAKNIGETEGVEIELDVEEQGYFFDPHVVGVMQKKRIDRGPEYEPSNSEKRKLARRKGMTAGSSKGFGGGSKAEGPGGK